VHHEVTGILLHHQDPQAVADAVTTVLNNPVAAHQYGVAGQALVQKEFTDTVRLGRLRELIGYTNEQQQLPTVSIIIPAYQSADTIISTLEAVRRQTWRLREVIVVDDGSTDGLESVITPYRSEVTYIRQDNAGAPVARNTGFDRSRGDLVLFLDADTILQPSAIEEMVRALQLHSNVDYVYSDFRFGWKHFRLHEYSVSTLKNMNYIHTTSLMRRQVFPWFDPTLKKFQDWDLWLTIAERGGRGMWIPNTLFTVQTRRRGLGMSQWLPSFLYQLPFIGQGKGNATIAAYRRGERVIRDKHHL
jgi:glycosyltransferase involved in cell wall biosynthesis